MTERAAGRKNTTQFVFAENSLDILRLFAALQIAITHYLNLTMLTYGKDGPGDGLLLGFKRALTLFPGLIILFSISGFLMGETLMRTQNRKIFAQKRILRLYPALWVNIVLTIGMLSLLPGAAAAQRIGELVSVHVIPRPHGDLEEVFPISFKGDSNI